MCSSDLTCGSGGMLLSAAEELRRQGKEHRTLKLYGQERNLTTSAIARMNLFLHGIQDFEVARGAICNQRRLCMLDDATGRPDGAACDVEGFYWSAGVTAGVLNRFAPDGTIERRIEVPMAAPTMPCFGGPDMRTLYVTGLTRNSATNPAKGSLISFRVDVAGAPIARFGEPLAPS